MKKAVFTLFLAGYLFAVASVTVAAESRANRAEDDAYVASLIEDGLYDAALAKLKSRPLENDEQAAQAFLSMVKIYCAIGNPARAREALRESEQLDPTNNRLIIERARVETVAGNIGKAKGALAEAKSARGLSLEQRVEIALLESRIELSLGNEAAARAALARVRGQERLVIEDSKVLVQHGKTQEAKSLLTGYLGSNPGSGRALTMLGRLAEAAGDTAGATVFYRRAIAQFSKSGDQARESSTALMLASLNNQAPEPTKEREMPPRPGPEDGVIIERTRPIEKAPPVAPPPVAAPERQAMRPPEPQVIAKALPFPAGSKLFTGSGFVIDGGRRVITNRHVIEGGYNFYVRNSLGDLSAAKVERVSKNDDLAVLLLEEPFASSRAVTANQFAEARAGANIAVIGFPLTDILGSITPSITNGIVIKTTGMQDNPDSFQVSAKMNKGNSGGAVFDTSGRIVGIAVAKLDTVKVMQGVGFLPEDVNFAIHVERLKGIGVNITPGPRPIKEMSLEDLYQQSIGTVVLVAGQRR